MRSGPLKRFSAISHCALSSGRYPDFGHQIEPKTAIKKFKLAKEILSERRKEKQAQQYVHLSFFQRNLLVLLSSFGAVIHPKRADFVANTSELVDEISLMFLLFRMRAHPDGKELLNVRPQVSHTVLNGARSCGKNSFGAAYAHFMGVREFSPRDRPVVRFIDNPDLAYLSSRIRESHDFLHVLFDCSTSVTSELKLKQIEFHLTKFPSAALSILVAPVRLNLSDRQSFLKLLSSKTQIKAKKFDLLSLNFEDKLTLPLKLLREELKVRSIGE